MRPVLLRTALLSMMLALAMTPYSVKADEWSVGRDWPPAQQISIDQVDHAPWTKLLQKYVDAQGMVDYRRWKASREDRQALDEYLNHLSQADPRKKASREARLAYWINAYNAVTIRGILREYPTSSIRNHTAKLFGYNIWQDLLLKTEGKNYSLEAIEHQVLRKLGEPRIHFAIVCASIGCPRLLSEAYVPDKLDEQLTRNAKHFFADPQKFRYDAASKTIYLSPILDWFAEDFGGSNAAVLRAIAPYLPDAARNQLAKQGGTIEYLEYDWGLNER